MKSKWKYAVIIIPILIFVIFIIKYIIDTQAKIGHVPVASYAVSVIETSTQTNRSTITYYDSQLQKQGKQNILYGGLSESEQPVCAYTLCFSFLCLFTLCFHFFSCQVPFTA